MRYGTSSLSKAVAYQVKVIQAHQMGTNNPIKRKVPPSVGSSCRPRASAATATTKHRSKNSSNHVEVRSSARSSSVRLRSTCGRRNRDFLAP